MHKLHELWFQKTLLLREHAAVYLLSVKILFANIIYIFIYFKSGNKAHKHTHTQHIQKVKTVRTYL